jgi:hypothetical protein
MAKSDYYCCDICNDKVYYDAEVDYEWNLGEIGVICKKCSANFEVVIRRKENTNG